MLTTGVVTDACLGVSLHVSRAGGDEGALPVHASLRFPKRARWAWERTGAAESMGRKKKVERPGHRVKAPSRAPGDGGATPGSGRYRIRTGTRPEGSWGVTPSWLLDYPACASERSCRMGVPSWEDHLHAGYNITPQARSRREDMPGGALEHRSGLPTGPCEPWILGILQIGQAPRHRVSRFPMPCHPIPGAVPPATVSDIAHRSLSAGHTRFLLGGGLSLVGLTLTARAAVRRPRSESTALYSVPAGRRT